MLTDFDGNESYSGVANAGSCGTIGGDNLVLYPNPSSGKFEILFTGDKSQVYSTEIYNSVGERVCMFTGFKSAFDLYNQASGVYFIQLHLQSKNLNQEVVVQK
jgi:hypothetical protein